MNPEDAGKAGHTLAGAAKILAVCLGLAAVIYAIRWW